MEVTDKTNALEMIDELMSEFDIKNKEVMQRNINGRKNTNKQTIFILNDVDFISGKYETYKPIINISDHLKNQSYYYEEDTWPGNQSTYLNDDFLINQKSKNNNLFITLLENYNLTLRAGRKSDGRPFYYTNVVNRNLGQAISSKNKYIDENYVHNHLNPGSGNFEIYYNVRFNFFPVISISESA